MQALCDGPQWESAIIQSREKGDWFGKARLGPPTVENGVQVHRKFVCTGHHPTMDGAASELILKMDKMGRA